MCWTVFEVLNSGNSASSERIYAKSYKTGTILLLWLQQILKASLPKRLECLHIYSDEHFWMTLTLMRNSVPLNQLIFRLRKSSHFRSAMRKQIFSVWQAILILTPHKLSFFGLAKKKPSCFSHQNKLSCCKRLRNQHHLLPATTLYTTSRPDIK